MAANRIFLNTGLDLTKRYQNAMAQAVGARRQLFFAACQELIAFRDTLVQARDGDGSQDSHFAEIQELMGVRDQDGVASNAKAHTLFNEIDSVVGHLTSGTSTSAQIIAAL